MTLIETIRYENGKLHLLELHQNRFDRSRTELYSTIESIDLATAIEIPTTIDQSNVYKVRVVYSKTIETIEWHEYSIKPIWSFQMVEDNHIEYHLKSTDRTRIESLEAQANRADAIIIVKNGMITDSAYANILLYDGEEWVTPDTPLLKGVMREHLIRIGVVEEKSISEEDFYSYELVALVNAMIPFGKFEPISVEMVNKLC